MSAPADPLRSVSAATVGPWLPLESNPDLLNEVGAKWGMPANFSFHEILSTSPDLLALVPQPVEACILLFPCTDNIYAARRKQQPSLTAPSTASPLLFLQQHSEFGNACGTIAAIHAIANTCKSASSSSPIGSFAKANAGLPAAAVGHSLLSNADLKSSSDATAQSSAAQTACPARDGAPLDHHFAAFVTHDSRCFELDGTKPYPVDHGPVSPASFLADVASIVRTQFMAHDPDCIEFSLIALCSS